MTLDLTVNGTSIKTIAAVVAWDSVFASAPLRGDNLLIPGVAGRTHLPKVRDSYVFSVPLVLLGTSWAGFQDKLNSLRALVDSSTTALTVTRTRPTGSGDLTETCLADYLGGLEPAMVNLTTGRVVLDLVNLSGGWT